MKFKKVKFFDMELNIETNMGSPYRLDNFFPILFLKYVPFKLGGKE